MVTVEGVYVRRCRHRRRHRRMELHALAGVRVEMKSARMRMDRMEETLKVHITTKAGD